MPGRADSQISIGIRSNTNSRLNGGNRDLVGPDNELEMVKT